MDITLLSEKSIRVKGKNSTVVINPTNTINKTEAEAIIKLEDSSDFSEKKVEGSRISVKGAGEYEISGVKISAIKVEGKLVARLEIDSVTVVVGAGPLLEKIHDNLEGCNLAVVEAEGKFNYSILASLEPNVLLVYGSQKEDVKKSLGKDAATVSKFSITSDKLPSEMQFVLLG